MPKEEDKGPRSYNTLIMEKFNHVMLKNFKTEINEYKQCNDCTWTREEYSQRQICQGV